MAVNERELEEDEAKLDNILHKIIATSKQIKSLSNEISEDHDQNNIVKQKFRLLSGIVENLALLADEITLHEEKITEELEDKIKDELGNAINNIQDVQKIFQD
ncbi:hypothetical protein ACFL1B_03105 [Nanoarchaeota archaeon]